MRGVSAVPHNYMFISLIQTSLQRKRDWKDQQCIDIFITVPITCMHSRVFQPYVFTRAGVRDNAL